MIGNKLGKYVGFVESKLRFSSPITIVSMDGNICKPKSLKICIKGWSLMIELRFMEGSFIEDLASSSLIPNQCPYFPYNHLDTLVILNKEKGGFNIVESPIGDNLEEGEIREVAPLLPLIIVGTIMFVD